MLRIESSDLEHFVIDYNGAKAEDLATLTLCKNGWQLTQNLQSKAKWIANASIDWPEAVKRSLIILI